VVLYLTTGLANKTTAGGVQRRSYRLLDDAICG
jgi:hypothetical protein